MKFNTVKQAQAWIESITKFGEKYDLWRMEKACELLGNPHQTFKSVHVGGTNGKGSTVTFLAQMLHEAGYRVGVYTSPYIVHFNERIMINQTMVDDATFLKHLNKIYTLEQTFKENYHDQLTFFELLTLVAFNVFAEEDLDLVIVEVGLGGLLDATNVITPLLSVITTIGYDHMNVLGNNLSSILRNKLGIAKMNIPLVTGIQQQTLVKEVKKHASERQIPLTILREQPVEESWFDGEQGFYFRGVPYTLSMLGLHQIDNAKTAILAAEELEKLGYFLPLEAKLEGIKNARWPGRFERFGHVILEGAHNEPGMKAACASLKSYFPTKKIISVFTVMKDKDYEPMLNILESVSDEIIFTQIDYPRCEYAETLKRKSSHPNTRILMNHHELVKEVKAQTDAIVFITGSLYLISAIRPYIAL